VPPPTIRARCIRNGGTPGGSAEEALNATETLHAEAALLCVLGQEKLYEKQREQRLLYMLLPGLRPRADLGLVL
jgi:hypothetical protein